MKLTLEFTPEQCEILYKFMSKANLNQDETWSLLAGVRFDPQTDIPQLKCILFTGPDVLRLKKCFKGLDNTDVNFNHVMTPDEMIEHRGRQ